MNPWLALLLGYLAGLVSFFLIVLAGCLLLGEDPRIDRKDET